MSDIHENYFHGGEGAVWTEHIDHTNLECRIWPRVIAISTRLWGYEINQPVFMVITDYGEGRKLYDSKVC